MQGLMKFHPLLLKILRKQNVTDARTDGQRENSHDTRPQTQFGGGRGYNQAVQPQKMTRSLKFRISKEEGLNYPCSENKGTDQLRGYAKLICVFVFANAKSRFSHDAAQIEICYKA